MKGPGLCTRFLLHGSNLLLTTVRAVALGEIVTLSLKGTGQASISGLSAHPACKNIEAIC